MKTQQIKINVPEPCHEDWNKMTPKAKGAFCSSCEKVVVDFTKMTDRDLINYLEQNKGKKTCGKFNSYQLDRKIVATTPAPQYLTQLKKFFLGLFVGLSFPSFLKAGNINNLPSSNVVIHDDANANGNIIKGKVQGEYGNGIAKAYVRVYQNGRITSIFTQTDEQGNFVIELPTNTENKDFELRVLSQDYYKASYQIESKDAVTIVMQAKTRVLGKMVIEPIAPVIEEPHEILGLPAIEEPAEIEPVEDEIVGDVKMEYLIVMPKEVVGKVTDEHGEPVAFATVLLEDTEVQVFSDLDGYFTVLIPEDLRNSSSLSLKVNMVGMVSETTTFFAENFQTTEATALSVKLRSLDMQIMGMMIMAPEIIEEESTSSFDKNYSEPDWKEQGYESKKAYKAAKK